MFNGESRCVPHAAGIEKRGTEKKRTKLFDKLLESISVRGLFPRRAVPCRSPLAVVAETYTGVCKYKTHKKPFSAKGNAPCLFMWRTRHGNNTFRSSRVFGTHSEGTSCVLPLPFGFRLSIILLFFFQILFLYTRSARVLRIRPMYNIRAAYCVIYTRVVDGRTYT